MFSHRLHAIVTAALATGALGMAFFAGTGAAHASSLDDGFLDGIASEGITFTSERAAVQQGGLVCNYLAHGRTGVSISDEIMSNSDLTAHQSAVFIVEAASAYCPSLMDQVTA
jgi:hypothetical protein